MAPINGTGGNDSINGTSGNDTIYAYGGNDTVNANDGNDTVYGGDGNDRVFGGDDRDTLYGGTGADTLYGDDDSDSLSGGDQSDTLYGGDDNDTLAGGADADMLDGGTGIDTADYSASATHVNVNLATGTGSHGDAAGDTLVRIENLTGSAFNDTLTGDSGANLLAGGAGNDSLDGGGGNDTLVGGAGADTLIGGSGTDLANYSASINAVNVSLATGTGTGGDAAGDTLSGIENVTGSANADTLTGDGNANMLTGGAGADSLSGGGGNDTLYGGSENDTLIGGAGVDTLYGGNENDLVSGGADQDLLYGGNGLDTIYGGLGDDLIFGGIGDDLLNGDSGNDTLFGGSGRDVFEFSVPGNADFIGDFSMAMVGAQTEDQLDVSDLTNPDNSPVKSYDVVISDDGSGNAVLTFPGGESVVLEGVSPATASQPGMLAKMGVPCFASGTRIQTPFGPRLVQDIVAGDLVSLAQGGVLPVLWHGRRVLSAGDLADQPHLRPIRVKAGHHGATRDLIVSPQHGFCVGGPRGPALVRARHLAELRRGAHVARGIRSVTYHHILLPRHALILAEGAATESFHPGRMALAALAPADRRSLAATLGCDPARIATSFGPRCLPLLSGQELSIWARSAPLVLST